MAKRRVTRTDPELLRRFSEELNSVDNIHQQGVIYSLLDAVEKTLEAYLQSGVRLTPEQLIAALRTCASLVEIQTLFDKEKSAATAEGEGSKVK